MSTTQSSTATRPASGSSRSRSERALRLFDDLIFENPEYCSTCFRRIRDETQHGDPVAERSGTGNKPTETLERVGAGEIGQDVEAKDAHGAKREYRARTYCGECGSPSGRASGARICSLQEAKSRAHNIIRALHRHGYYPDTDALYRAVEGLKTDPDNQGQDREIFAIATYLAIQHGADAPEVPGRVQTGRLRRVTDDDGHVVGYRHEEWRPAQKPRWLTILEEFEP